MTAEQQRIAIGLACGYQWRTTVRLIPKGCPPVDIPESRRVRYLALPEEVYETMVTEPAPESIPIQDGAHLGVPDYPNDLNAMHEAEKALVHVCQWQRYLEMLWRTVNGGYEVGGDKEIVHRQNFLMRNMVFATAAQRAEAFLRALNLWTP